MKTLLVALSHTDDEMGCAGTIRAHAERGDRVVLLWLTRGEMSGAMGDLTAREVADIRTEHGETAAAMLGAEPRFLDMPDTAVAPGPDPAREVARVMADVAPDAVLTWGDAWLRGPRHPDHQATGKIVRDAVTLARIGRIVTPHQPHRGFVPVFTIRDEHSTLPAAVVDVAPHLDVIQELATFYRERMGWPPETWRERLRTAGRPYGLEAAETFDAWETGASVGTTLF